MKRLRISVLALLLASCGKKEPPPAPPPAAEKPALPAEATAKPSKNEDIRRKAPPVPRPSDAPPASYVPSRPHVPPPPDPVAPIVGLSANNSDDVEIPPGWPLVLRLRVHPSPGGLVRLPAKDGSWAGLLRLETTLPLKAGPRAVGELTLEPGTSGMLVWTVSAAELDALPRGKMTIVATLDSSSAEEGFWKGTRSASATLTLLSTPSKLSPLVADLTRISIEIDAMIAQGDGAAGVAIADAALKQRPTNPMLHGMRGRAFEASGRLEDALTAYARAAEETVKSGRPGTLWANEQRRLTAALLKK